MSEFYTYGKTNCWHCRRELPEEEVHIEEFEPRHWVNVCQDCCTCNPKRGRR